MPDFKRPHHRLVAIVLKSMDADFLAQARCYFGGGTLLAMALGEYRESRDVDFLCSSREGFRLLRQQVTNRSLGRILRRPVEYAREIRADRDGIRTFLDLDGVPIKFEIILEARIDLDGKLDKKLGVPTLNMECAIAEKLLANADRGLDESTLARDLIDLAFAAAHAGKNPLREALELAEQAYGTAVWRSLRLSLDNFKNNRSRANACIRSLGIEDTRTLRKGLRILGSVAESDERRDA
jgi:hypothetical protein